MNVKGQHNRDPAFNRNAVDGGSRQPGRIVHFSDYACCGAFVAVSIISVVAFVVLAEWF